MSKPVLSLARSAARALLRNASVEGAALWTRLAPRAARRLRNRQSWLLGGTSGAVYGDNAAALHGYLREHHPDLDVYWVIDRDSPDVARARAVGPVLYRGALGTYRRALLAHVIVISHGVHDVPGMTSRHSCAFAVHVGHGIHAFKNKRPPYLKTMDQFGDMFDLMLASSPFEKKIKERWGVGSDKIAVTGLPRYDVLLDKQHTTSPDPSRIVYMPTWRRNEPAAYARAVEGLIQSERLAQLLSAYGARLDVVFHPMARDLLSSRISDPPSDLIRVADASDPQDLFVQAGALVTDYSSVAWDFVFLDKPVLFYQFDRETYAASFGPDMRGRAWPGAVSTTEAGLVADLERYLRGDLAADERLAQTVAAWKNDIFAFADDQNRARVVGAIFRRLSNS